MRAVGTLKSQFFDPKAKEPQTFNSDPKFLAMIEARGRHFGAMIGAGFGEAFVTKLPPRVSDVIAAYGGREVGYRTMILGHRGTVVIPTLNEEDTLVARLGRSSRSADEIIVVD